jgi:hypothetical protein
MLLAIGIAGGLGCGLVDVSFRPMWWPVMPTVTTSPAKPRRYGIVAARNHLCTQHLPWQSVIIQQPVAIKDFPTEAADMLGAWSDFQVVRVWGMHGHAVNMAWSRLVA